MRDWCEKAARKLPDSKLSAAEREEISRELAGYLEDLYGDARNRGLDDSLRSEKLRNNTRIALRELLTATSLTVGIGRLKRILMFLRLVQL